jgi:hypothetical protein
VAAVALGGVGGGIAFATWGPSGDDPSGSMFDEVAGIPLLAGAYRTDGDLADDLVVPSGAVLLGDVLPIDQIHTFGRTELAPGWKAALLAVGPLPDIVDDLDRQATGLGLELLVGEDFFGAHCEAASSYVPAAGTVECRRAWLGGSAELYVSIVRGLISPGAASATTRPVSVLSMEYADLAELGPSTASLPESTASSTTTVPDPPLPDGWPEPPGAGEGLGDGILGPADPNLVSLRVPPGAHAVVVPWPIGGNAANYATVLAITGDLDAVLADLLDQISVRTDGVVSAETSTIDGIEVRTIYGSQAGGDEYDLHAATIKGRSWVMVRTGYD